MVRNKAFTEGLRPLKQREGIIVRFCRQTGRGGIVVHDNSSYIDEMNKI